MHGTTISAKCLYSVWNITRKHWATSTNYSTRQEAQALIRTITRQVRDKYEVRERAFGTIKE